MFRLKYAAALGCQVCRVGKRLSRPRWQCHDAPAYLLSQREGTDVRASVATNQIWARRMIGATNLATSGDRTGPFSAWNRRSPASLRSAHHHAASVS